MGKKDSVIEGSSTDFVWLENHPRKGGKISQTRAAFKYFNPTLIWQLKLQLHSIMHYRYSNGYLYYNLLHKTTLMRAGMPQAHPMMLLASV